MRLLFTALLILSAVSPRSAWAEDPVERERRRLEELFIWKMSEELKLPVEIEASFTEAMRLLNREKAKANTELAAALAALEKAQSTKRPAVKTETNKALKRYERAVKTYGELPLREMARLRRILGSERLGRYLIAKSQMAEKLKSMSARDAGREAGRESSGEAPTSDTK